MVDDAIIWEDGQFSKKSSLSKIFSLAGRQFEIFMSGRRTVLATTEQKFVENLPASKFMATLVDKPSVIPQASAVVPDPAPGKLIGYCTSYRSNDLHTAWDILNSKNK
jgi:hypothetical protein